MSAWRSERTFPFQAALRIPRDEARSHEFFRKWYGFDETPSGQPAAGKMSEGDAWRRIDEEWLSSSEELALQLDNCINNTSLVLAIEFD